MGNGFVGALLVIPQAITFAHLAGLPPEMGLFSAVYVTFFACLFGGSIILGGPNTAVSIQMGAALLPFAGSGSPLYVELAIILSLLVGMIQMLAWGGRLATTFQYINPATITGITVGVGVLIMLASLDPLLGMEGFAVGNPLAKLFLLATAGMTLINPYATLVGGVTLTAGFLARRRYPRFFLLHAMLAGYVTGMIIHAFRPQVETEIALLGALPFAWLPLSSPSWQWETWLMVPRLLGDALAIAFIGLAQTMVIARQLNLNNPGAVAIHRETFAQGIANLLAPFFSSFAGSASFNRTAVNQAMGAASPLTGIIASLFVWGLIALFGGLFRFLPVPVMGGMLFLVGWGMIKPAEIRLLRLLKREQAGLAVTALAVIFLDLTAGIVAAVLFSLIPFLLGAARLDVRPVRIGATLALEFQGNLFFATLEKLAATLEERRGEAGLILNLKQVSTLDPAAGAMLVREGQRRQQLGQRLAMFVDSRVHHTLLERLDPNRSLILVGSMAEAREAMLAMA